MKSGTEQCRDVCLFVCLFYPCLNILPEVRFALACRESAQSSCNGRAKVHEECKMEKVK